MALWIDDGFDMWPEVVAAGSAAVGLYTRCGAWLARTVGRGLITSVEDAVIPVEVARTYGTAEWAQRLVDVRLWRLEGTAYRDLRHFDLNPTPEKVAADRAVREKKKEAGRLGGLASGKARNRSKSEADASAGASRLVEHPSLPSSPKGEGRGEREPCRAGHRGETEGACGRCRSERLEKKPPLSTGDDT